MFIDFLSNCEIQEWEVTDPQSYKSLLLFSWVEILVKQEVLKTSTLFVVSHLKWTIISVTVCMRWYLLTKVVVVNKFILFFQKKLFKEWMWQVATKFCRLVDSAFFLFPEWRNCSRLEKELLSWNMTCQVKLKRPLYMHSRRQRGQLQNVWRSV